MSHSLQLKEIYKNLPMKCATYVESLDVVGLITKGVKGYVPIFDVDLDFIQRFNRDNGVDEAIRQAMIVGATQGWSSPDINPENHKTKF